MNIDLGLALAVLGGFVGLAGWLSGRDKSVKQDAEWRGSINAKLDVLVGIRKDVDGLLTEVKEHEGRLCGVENSVKSAHHRIDGFERRMKG